MAQVHDVAAALIRGQESAGRTIDKMQLQKLLYLVQGGTLARTARPAFNAAIRAYRYGPVVTEVEDTYRDLVDGKGFIDRPLGGDPSRLDQDTARVVDDVLTLFGGWTGPNLEKLTKRPGSPWHLARPGIPAGATSKNVIEVDDIADWFAAHPLDPNSSQIYAPTRDVDLEDVAGGPVGFDDRPARWDDDDTGGYAVDRSKFTILD